MKSEIRSPHPLLHLKTFNDCCLRDEVQIFTLAYKTCCGYLLLVRLSPPFHLLLHFFVTSSPARLKLLSGPQIPYASYLQTLHVLFLLPGILLPSLCLTNFPHPYTSKLGGFPEPSGRIRGFPVLLHHSSLGFLALSVLRPTRAAFVSVLLTCHMRRIWYILDAQ